ncbi:MAG: HD domain-containing protein [Candidatus Izemoplasmatales bacterium]
MKIPEVVKEKMNKLEQNGYEAYIVGGAVRDSIFGQEPKDYDIFTNASGDNLKSIFPNGKILGNKERQEKVFTIIEDDIEISQYRANGERTEFGNDIHTHLETCDLNINALASNSDGVLLAKTKTFHDAWEDILNKTLRTPGDPYKRIAEDKLRVFRIIRFALKYNFKIENNLLQAIQQTDISDIAKERIREEFIKIIQYENAIDLLNGTKLLYKLFPDFQKTHFIDGGKYHNETLYEHLKGAHKIMASLTPSYLLCISALFHDYGKISSYQKDENSELTFKGHDKEGEEKVKAILEDLKFSTLEINYICCLIRNHMKPHFFNPKYKTKRNTLLKLFSELKTYNIDIEEFVLLHYCDHQSNLANERIKFFQFFIDSYLLKTYKEAILSNRPFDLKDIHISGTDINELGLKPGRKYKEILNFILEMTMEGKIKNDKPSQLELLKKLVEFEITLESFTTNELEHNINKIREEYYNNLRK